MLYGSLSAAGEARNSTAPRFASAGHRYVVQDWTVTELVAAIDR